MQRSPSIYLKLADLHICAYVRYETFFRQFLTGNADKTLVQSVVISRLDYCNSVYIRLPMKSIIYP